MDYVMIADVETAEQALATLRLSRCIAFDLETQGLDPYTCAVLLFAFKGEQGPVYLMRPHSRHAPNPYAESILWPLFEDRVMLAHNAAFEYMFMAQRMEWSR